MSCESHPRCPINNLAFVCFDFETYGLSAETSEVIEVAGKAYNPRTLEPYPVSAGGEFVSMMKPLYPERLDTPGAQKALDVNKKTKAEILAAPDQKLVWNQFVDWVNKWNPKRNRFGAPIALGKNIRNFDYKFLEVLNGLHCKNKEKTLLFNPQTDIDLQDYIFAWFENSTELENGRMDTLRTYFGMSHEGAHSALVDVRQTGDLIMKFLKLKRTLAARPGKDGGKFIEFKNCCAKKGA